VKPGTRLTPAIQWPHPIARPFLLALVFVLAGCSQVPLHVQQSFQASPGAILVERYPSGSIKSVEVADQALSEINKEQARIEAQHAAEQRACYPKFFTTSCLDEAKERRRYALAQIRPIEIQAEIFKRRDVVEKRDKALAQKREEEIAEAPQREKEAKAREIANAKREADSARRMEEAKQKAEAAEAAPVSNRKETAAPAARPESSPRQVKPRKELSEEQRAANVAAFEKKERDAKARQEKIAADKEKKEAEIARKKAETKAP
jgi:colicin import membrane protein